MILHYSTMAEDTTATGVLVAYKQLPRGMSYCPAFSQRAIGPLVEHFDQNPELLIYTAGTLGSYKADFGDVSVTIGAFTCVPVTLVLGRGYEELAPNGNILFDANSSDYLSTEAIAVLCATIVWKLVKGAPSPRPVHSREN